MRLSNFNDTEFGFCNEQDIIVNKFKNYDEPQEYLTSM